MENAISMGTNILDGVIKNNYENVAMNCYYNDSSARDK